MLFHISYKEPNMSDKSSFSRPPFLGGLYWKTLAMCIIFAAGAAGQALFAMDAAAQDAEPKSAPRRRLPSEGGNSCRQDRP